MSLPKVISATVTTTPTPVYVGGKKALNITVGTTDVLILLCKTEVPQEEGNYTTLNAGETYRIKTEDGYYWHILCKTASGSSTLTIEAGDDLFFRDVSALKPYIVNGIGNPLPANKSLYDYANDIKTKTDNLPAAPANEVTAAAIKAKTDNLPATPAPKPTFTSVYIATSGYQSADLEEATKTITATTRPESADYSTTNNLTAPTNSKLTVTNIAFKLTLDIDSLSSGSKLMAEVLINGQKPIDAGEFAVAGTNVAIAGNLTVTSSADVIAKTAEIRLWKDVDGTGDTVISECTLQIVYGVAGTAYRSAFTLNATGLTKMCGTANRYGSGTINITVGVKPGAFVQLAASGLANATVLGALAPVANLFIATSDANRVYLSCTAETDVCFLTSLGFVFMEFA